MVFDHITYSIAPQKKTDKWKSGEEDGEETIAGKANLVNEAVKYLEEHNGTTPDKNEIAEFTHLTMEELSDIMDIMKKAEKKGK